MDKKTQLVVASGTVALIVLMIGLAVWSSKHTQSESAADAATSTVATTTDVTDTSVSEKTYSPAPALPTLASTTPNKVDGLSVLDQPAGKSVDVTGVSTAKDNWVVVYDGTSKYPMGAGLLMAGANVADYESPLLRATEAGKTYYVAVIPDSGDRVYDFTKDAWRPGMPIVSFIAK